MRADNDNTPASVDGVIASYAGGSGNMTVYALSADGNHLSANNCRYIGLTCQGRKDALLAHITEASALGPDGTFKFSTHRARWIRSVIAEEGRDSLRITPLLVGLNCDRGPNGAGAAERALIAAYRADGARLTNATAGGEGVPASGGEKRVAKSEYMRVYLANRRASDPDFAAKQREANRNSMAERYANDNEFREKSQQKSRVYGVEYRARKRSEGMAA